MNLFSYYQSLKKAFPIGPSGFLEPNFKREWVLGLSRSKFALDDAQNLATWQRELPTLDEDSKKAAMRNVIKFMGSKKVDDNTPGVGAQPTLALLTPYLSVFTDQDALAWTTAFMSADLSERSAQNHEIPTLTFAAHLLDWIRENHPSVLKKSVAMLESWEPITQSKVYKDDEIFAGALERLSGALPNTKLEQTCALVCAISGQELLLSSLLSREQTNTTTLFKHAQALANKEVLFSMLSGLSIEGKSQTFLANAASFGQHMLAVYKEQTHVEHQEKSRAQSGEEQHQRCRFLLKLGHLGVECGDEGVALLKRQASQMAIPRFFHFLGELAKPWSPAQHASFMAHWSEQGGYYVGEDMFGNKDNRKAVLNALAKLPPTWTEWFEYEYRDNLKTAAEGLLNPKMNQGISIEGHRWFYEHMPRMYQHWIRGLPANPELLGDPIVGETAWTYTQAGSESFLYQATAAWIESPDVNYDLRHEGYLLAQLAWARQGVDLDTSLTGAMLDTHCDYRALALEAISPGMGKNRWHALVGIVDIFKESKDSVWIEHPLVQDVIRTCMAERLNPSATPELRIDNGHSLFA